jgi:hypothetical protein
MGGGFKNIKHIKIAENQNITITTFIQYSTTLPFYAALIPSF